MVRAVAGALDPRKADRQKTVLHRRLDTLRIGREGQLDRTESDGDSETASRPVRSESVTANTADDVKRGMAKYPGKK